MVKGDVIVFGVKSTVPSCTGCSRMERIRSICSLALKVAAIFWSTSPSGSYSLAAAKRNRGNRGKKVFRPPEELRRSGWWLPDPAGETPGRSIRTRRLPAPSGWSLSPWLQVSSLVFSMYASCRLHALISRMVSSPSWIQSATARLFKIFFVPKESWIFLLPAVRRTAAGTTHNMASAIRQSQTNMATPITSVEKTDAKSLRHVVGEHLVQTGAVCDHGGSQVA